jgi:N-methylhydantoinase B
MQTDPLAFEALRHRITMIADEGSAVLKMVSSSPVAAEANDCNVAIMNFDGSAVAIGPGLGGHGIGCMMTARYVRTHYEENPGFREGDMFLANDPYTCTTHQTCVALVTPVWWKGELLAWVGAGIHVPDAGGPVPGQVSVGATSIFQEATPMLPMRIVEGGVIRKDLEAEFVTRSRTPEQLSLDLRALIAACERLSSRLREMFEQHTGAGITTVFEDMIEFNRAHLGDRLNRIPDGDWGTSVWLDFPQPTGVVDFYECKLELRKRGDHLTVDVSQSSAQAGAVINCGEPGLVSGIVNGLMAVIGYGLPLCPEAMLRTITIESRPGTFVHATRPAGCSKATTAACHALIAAINLGVSKMFSDVPDFRDRALAGSGGFLPVIDVEGIDQRGSRFGAPLLDIALSAGYGAMSGDDGIDSAGMLGSPFQSISNVETYEARYPLLYLWRRHERDSGGLGQQRGGRGVGLAWTPYRAGSPIGAVLHGHGCAITSTPGLQGGAPGATNTYSLARGSSCLEELAAGRVPQGEDELGVVIEQTSGLHWTQLQQGDVVIACNNGGGGFGDPLTRDVDLVATDVREGAVSVEWARRGYGVVIDGGVLDEGATVRLRQDLRRDRLTHAATSAQPAHRQSSVAVCGGCGADLSGDVVVTTNRRSLTDLGARVLPSAEDPLFFAQESVCPGCGTLLDVTVTTDVAKPQLGQPERLAV